MGPSIIARNYAETLLELARRNGGDSAIDEYGIAIDEVATLLRTEPLVRDFIETPRVDLAAKMRALRSSFGGRAPEHFVRFLEVVVAKRRQSLLIDIAAQYQELVDEVRGRSRAEIIVAREPDEDLRKLIVAGLERRLGGSVVPVFKVDPAILGGIVVRFGGEILDGSLRTRAAGLRRRMMETVLPAANAAGNDF